MIDKEGLRQLAEGSPEGQPVAMSKQGFLELLSETSRLASRVQELEEVRESDNRNWKSCYQNQQDRILELEKGLRALITDVEFAYEQDYYPRPYLEVIAEAERALAGKKEK